MKTEPTKEEIDNYCNKLIAKFKESPTWELEQEFGRLLMIHINDFTPEQRKRYDELKKILLKAETNNTNQ